MYLYQSAFSGETGVIRVHTYTYVYLYTYTYTWIYFKELAYEFVRVASPEFVG